MNAMNRTFRVGDIDIRGFSDGRAKTSLDFVVGLDRAASEALAGPTDNGSLFIPVNNFVFERDGAVIMIDAGTGTQSQPTLGKLPENLRAGGIDPAAVTHIILTHLHSDHANGLIDATGAAVYPNAELLVHADEHDFWMAPIESHDPAPVKRARAQNQLNLAPYRERVRRVRDGEEFFGCAPILAPGHSPGHTCWRVSAGREAFLAWGDLVHFGDIQIARPDVAVTYDLDPDLARASRVKMLDMVASERLPVCGAHVSAPGFGHVTRKGAGYAFEPA